MEKNVLEKYNESEKEKKVRIIEKKINGWWYYFLNFYFIITFSILIGVLVISIIYIFPHLSEIREYYPYTKNLIAEGLDYLKTNGG